MPRRPLRVALMGAPLNTGNRGVTALGASLVSLVEAALPGATITMLIGNRDALPMQARVRGRSREIEVVNYRLSPGAPLREQFWWILLTTALYRICPLARLRGALARWVPWIGAVVAAEVVADIRGGDSFSDIYGGKRFLIGSLAVISVIWVKGSIVLLPQTYGPFRSSLARRLARYVVRRSSTALSRDQAGIREVQRLTRGRCVPLFCPDVAFALEPIEPARWETQPPLPPLNKAAVVGLNINGLMFNGGYNRSNMFGLSLDYPRFVLALAEELLSNPEVELLLVPHTFAPPTSVESDTEACRRLQSQVRHEYRQRVHMVQLEYDAHEIKWIIGQSAFFIGSRMHACIAALSQGIPVVAVAYSAKFSGVFESVGAEEWVIDGRAMDVQRAVQRVNLLFAKREELRVRLGPRVAAAKRQLADVFGASLRRGASDVSNSAPCDG